MTEDTEKIKRDFIESGNMDKVIAMMREAADCRIARQAAAHTPVRREVMAGRNDPCPCGSGKKFKKCCIQKESTP